jgi:YVTN family beta-propeller protein
MSSRVAKWVFVLVAGVALSALGAAPQPGTSPHIVLEQPPWEQLPKIEPFITGLGDIKALLLNAAGTKGYIVHVHRDDKAFITEFTVPNTKGGQCELGVLSVSAAAYDEANAHLWVGVGNFHWPHHENSILIVDVSKPLENKCVVVATIPDLPSPLNIKFYKKDDRVYVILLLMNSSIYVLARKAGEKEEYELKATADLSAACLGPNAMALGADALFVACTFSNNSNNVVRVNLGTWKVDGAAPAGAEPVDIKFYGDKLYVAAAGSDTLEIIDAVTLQPIASVSIPGLQTCEPHPRYVEVSPEGRFVYVSNAADQSVSIICRATAQLLTTFRAIAPTIITAPGVIAAVDHQGKHLLYVADKGGRLQIFVMDWAYSQYATECP